MKTTKRDPSQTKTSCTQTSVNYDMHINRMSLA